MGVKRKYSYAEAEMLAIIAYMDASFALNELEMHIFDIICNTQESRYVSTPMRCANPWYMDFDLTDRYLFSRMATLMADALESVALAFYRTSVWLKSVALCLAAVWFTEHDVSSQDRNSEAEPSSKTNSDIEKTIPPNKFAVAAKMHEVVARVFAKVAQNIRSVEPIPVSRNRLKLSKPSVCINLIFDALHMATNVRTYCRQLNVEELLCELAREETISNS